MPLGLLVLVALCVGIVVVAILWGAYEAGAVGRLLRFLASVMTDIYEGLVAAAKHFLPQQERPPVPAALTHAEWQWWTDLLAELEARDESPFFDGQVYQHWGPDDLPDHIRTKYRAARAPNMTGITAQQAAMQAAMQFRYLGFASPNDERWPLANIVSSIPSGGEPPPDDITRRPPAEGFRTTP